MADTPLYAGFLGIWTLIPESCDYEQGEPPKEATYRIAVEGEELVFVMYWVDSDGSSQQVEFSGPPNGKPIPLDAGELADSLVVRAVSARELTTSAYSKGEELMVAQRQLDETGTAMRITQIVRFPNGSSECNVGVYRKSAAA
ncbi:MAG: hypothetical protein GY811_17820 [Myxococcales bacterium]|nr:hypothetical protein [Myxococcales bacterium]